MEMKVEKAISEIRKLFGKRNLSTKLVFDGKWTVDACFAEILAVLYDANLENLGIKLIKI